MPDLDSIEPSRHEWLETLSASTVRRVRPDGYSARIVRNRDRILDREPVFGHERAPVVAEVSHERLAEVGYKSARNQRPRDVWPADCAAIRLLKDFVERERNPEGVELLHNLSSPNMTRCAQLRQTLLERIEVGKMECEHVDFPLFIERTELHTCDYANTHGLGGLARRANTIDGVVIREGERGQAATRRSLDYVLGRKCAVRGCRVRVQVDESRRARLAAHRS